MSWRLKRTAQCDKCPWRREVDPHQIPNGYDVDKHRALAVTIADPNDVLGQLRDPPHTMACHESHDAHCVGWLHNQLGTGNNVALRMQVRDCDNIGKLRLRGPQHRRFEDTLPKSGD